MSPNSHIAFNDRGLLCGYLGEAEHEDPCFIWTYSEFEAYLNESVCPSMYHFMASYVYEHFSKNHLWEIAGGDYCTGDLEEAAVNAYFELPLQERIDMHMQEMTNLEAERDRAAGKEAAFIDAILDDACPFDVQSPIYVEYCQWCREQKEKWAKIHFDLCCQLDEETDWRGGHEEGASDLDTDERYSPMEE
jgi:hypothetical protein